MYFNTSSTRVVLSAMLVAASFSAFADEQSVQQKYDEAVAEYGKRSSSNLKPTEHAIELLKEIEGKSEKADLNYDIYILEARSYYWNGTHSSANSDKVTLHDQGQKKADQAKALNPKYADAYYFAGINLARWAEANGVLESLGRRGELEGYMKQSMARPARDGKPGKNIDGCGADRVLGRMFFKLPSLFGGSYEKSIFHLTRAYTTNPEFVLNGVYYAETLSTSSNSQDKATAKQVLTFLLSKSPQQYKAERLPETLDELELAKKLLESLN